MSAQNAVASEFQAPAAAATRKSFWTRVFEGMVERAEQQAIARMAALDPRLAGEIRAARDRAERESMQG